ncbi:MAG: hypothetical protein LBH93_01635 [Chitinispirillales bacterium]|nr:hypothetical protein [Chitinispirillales bacterium]
MIHNIPKPSLSPDFTIDDIHKIREWNYERLKDSTLEEREAESKRKMLDYIERFDLVFDRSKNAYVHYPKGQ